MSSPASQRAMRDPLVRNILGPALLLGAYLLVLAFLLPTGINKHFVVVTGLLVVTVIVATGLGRLLALLIARRRPAPRELAVVADDRPRAGDITLLLLPMAPVVQYTLVNTEEVPWPGGLVVVGLLTLLAAAIALVIPYVLRGVMSWSVTLVVGLALTFVLYEMAALARANAWNVPGDAGLALAIFGGIIVLGIATYRAQPKAAYAFAALYFVSTIVLLPAGGSTGTTASPPDDASAEARSAALAAVADLDERPDIIVLTYDAYVPNETMLGYGIDNAEQEAYLESLGFEVHRDVYSVAGGSVESMGRLLGATVPGEGVAGRGPLLDGLRAAGYETHGVFETDYFFRRVEPGYDTYFPDPWPPSLSMIHAILEGQFRFEFSLAKPEHEEYVAAKRAVLASESEDPLFLYTHSGPSHSQNTGRCLPDEVERFETRLEEANVEMRQDLELVMEARPDAVIIVNGDHGPYLTKNCFVLDSGSYSPSDVTRLDIQDRFGTFVAVRWPEDRDVSMPEIDVLQDVMAAVLSDLDDEIDYEALRGSARIAEEQRRVIAGVDVVDGTIVGGVDDGEPLFVGADADR